MVCHWYLFHKKWIWAETSQPGLEFGNFKPRLESCIIKCISSLNSSFFSRDDRGFLKEEVKSYLIWHQRPHIYSLWLNLGLWLFERFTSIISLCVNMGPVHHSRARICTWCQYKHQSDKVRLLEILSIFITIAIWARFITQELVYVLDVNINISQIRWGYHKYCQFLSPSIEKLFHIKTLKIGRSSQLYFPNRLYSLLARRHLHLLSVAFPIFRRLLAAGRHGSPPTRRVEQFPNGAAHETPGDARRAARSISGYAVKAAGIICEEIKVTWDILLQNN